LEKNNLPTSETIKLETIESRSEVVHFDHTTLKPVDTVEKNSLPTAATLYEEMRPETLPDLSELNNFDNSKLKNVETIERTALPNAEMIRQESIESRVEIKFFDQASLKTVETIVKNPLPTADILEEEVRPGCSLAASVTFEEEFRRESSLDLSQVTAFDIDSLKKVETVEKLSLSSDSNETEEVFSTTATFEVEAGTTVSPRPPSFSEPCFFGFIKGKNVSQSYDDISAGR